MPGQPKIVSTIAAPPNRLPIDRQIIVTIGVSALGRTCPAIIRHSGIPLARAPVLVRYVRWLGEALTGNLGESYQFGESVFAQLSRKLPATVQLAGGALVVTVAVSFPLGIAAAVRKNKLADWLIRLISFVGISLPNFWLALILLYYSVRRVFNRHALFF